MQYYRSWNIKEYMNHRSCLSHANLAATILCAVELLAIFAEKNRFIQGILLLVFGLFILFIEIFILRLGFKDCDTRGAVIKNKDKHLQIATRTIADRFLAIKQSQQQNTKPKVFRFSESSKSKRKFKFLFTWCDFSFIRRGIYRTRETDNCETYLPLEKPADGGGGCDNGCGRWWTKVLLFIPGLVCCIYLVAILAIEVIVVFSALIPIGFARWLHRLEISCWVFKIVFIKIVFNFFNCLEWGIFYGALRHLDFLRKIPASVELARIGPLHERVKCLHEAFERLWDLPFDKKKTKKKTKNETKITPAETSVTSTSSKTHANKSSDAESYTETAHGITEEGDDNDHIAGTTSHFRHPPTSHADLKSSIKQRTKIAPANTPVILTASMSHAIESSDAESYKERAHGITEEGDDHDHIAETESRSRHPQNPEEESKSHDTAEEGDNLESNSEIERLLSVERGNMKKSKMLWRIVSRNGARSLYYPILSKQTPRRFNEFLHNFPPKDPKPPMPKTANPEDIGIVSRPSLPE